MGRVLAVVAALAAFPFLYGVVAFTWFAVHDPDSAPLGQAVLGSGALIVASLLLAYAGAALGRSPGAARARDWLPAGALLGVATAGVAVAVAADDLPEPVVVVGALGLGVALLCAYVLRWEYGLGITVVLVVVLLLVGGLAPA
jgi:hypothetical protein